jgi:hypothetical protein
MLRTDVYLSSFNTTTKRLPNTNVTVVEITAANSVFCPQGTAVPLTVRPGYYTVGSNRTTRFAQSPCPMGSYCVNGYVHARSPLSMCVLVVIASWLFWRAESWRTARPAGTAERSG